MDVDIPIVPNPVPPDDHGAWYAPDVHDQYEIVPGVVATVEADGSGFSYDVREPSLSASDAADLRAVSEHFADAKLRRPRTRQGTAERFEAGFDERYERIIDRITSCRPAGRRRLEYHALAELRCLGTLTPHALDTKVEVSDDTADELAVHLTDYAPAKTGIEDATFAERFTAERIERYTVEFAGYELPVVRYRERVLGGDPFERKYAVLEPDRLPGDDELIAECKAQIWDGGVDGIGDEAAFEDRLGAVRERSRQLVSRRLGATNTDTWIRTLRHGANATLAAYDLAVSSVDRRFSDDRIDDLVYYVLRDLIGYGQLTIPIRDPNLEDIEANRVGERIKVVPRGSGREPTNLAFESETAFVNVVTQLAADDGVELSANRPTAKITIEPDGLDQPIRCAVALPAVSEGGPHVSIRKQAPEALTPVDLIDSGSISTALVTLLWMLYKHAGVVLFSGPTGVGKTTLLNAHLPFVDYDARPISIDSGAKDVHVPHETGVSLVSREHRDEFKGVSVSDLLTETGDLNPDIDVIAEIDASASFDAFGSVLRTGRGVLGTTRAENVDAFLNRLVEKGLPTHLLSKIDLIVVPTHVDGDRYVETAVEVLSEDEAEQLVCPTETVAAPGGAIHYNRVAHRTAEDGWTFAYRHPKLGDPTSTRELRTLDRLATRTNRVVSDVEAEFHRKHGYVEYLVREGISDHDAFFGFLNDLRTNEAATVERIHRQRDDDE
ncbi:MAG: type II/IV secretion system ATPase subunit [Halobacteriota archaeon]